jgi:hypothetical protein
LEIRTLSKTGGQDRKYSNILGFTFALYTLTNGPLLSECGYQFERLDRPDLTKCGEKLKASACPEMPATKAQIAVFSNDTLTVVHVQRPCCVCGLSWK